MHECPGCGQACDCIGDDTWDDTEAWHCQCTCEWLRDNTDEDDGIMLGFEDDLDTPDPE